MNIEKTVPTFGAGPSTLLVARNEEAPVEKINVTLVNYDGSVFWNSGIEPGNAVTLPVPSREGYEFVGWSFSEDGSKLFDFSTSITDDITFHAVWKDRSLVHVSFYDGQNLIKEGYYKAGEKYCFPSVDYLGKGFVVSGWLKEGEGRLISDSFFELSFSEEDITFKVYITTDLLTINTNGVIKAADSLKAKSNSISSLIIPNSIEGTIVTTIGDWTFSGCSCLTNIVISDSVTIIGQGAFAGCTSLISINLPNSISSIGSGAFYKCQSLTSIIVPDSVISIGSKAFFICESLTNVTIGNSVSLIGDYAFGYCKKLFCVTLGNSVTSIGAYAFWGCSILIGIDIPNSVTSIGDHAFGDCNLLINIDIPDTVTSIGDGVFSNCFRLININVSGNNNCYKSIDGVLFDKLGKTIICYPQGKTESEYTIPDTVTSIVDCAFENCERLTCINIPDSVTSIGNRAFFGCYSLTAITLPDSVTSIGESVFSYCENLVFVTIGNSVTSIGDSAFSYCTKLFCVTIGNSVLSIGAYAFLGCATLTSIDIPSAVTFIGDYAFSQCKRLLEIDIPDTVTSMGNGVFTDCSNLTEINVSGENNYYKSIDGVLFDKSGKTIICYPQGKT